MRYIPMKKSNLLPINRFLNLTAPQRIQRLIAAWLLVSLFFFAVSKAPFTTHAYYDRIHFWLFTSVTALLFLLLCMIQHDKYITLMLILTAELYFAGAAASYGDYVFSFGLCLILCGIVFYSDLKNIAVRFSCAAL